VVKDDDSLESAKKVNDIFLKLERLRLKSLNPVEQVVFWCYTNHPNGLETDLLDIQIAPLSEENYDNDPSFRKLDILASPKFFEDKVVVIDIDTVPMDLAQESIFSCVPHRGQITELNSHYGLKDLTEEQLSNIEEHKLPYIKIATDWQNENKPSDAIIFCNGYDGYGLMEHYKTEGNPNNLTLGEYIEEHFKGIVLKTAPGLFTTYFANDVDRNKELNPVWKTEVAEKYFPKYFEGFGSEEDDQYIYFGHEYKTLTRQCKWVRIDESKGSRHHDLFTRLWLL
jgi:hypothetical protein